MAVVQLFPATELGVGLGGDVIVWIGGWAGWREVAIGSTMELVKDAGVSLLGRLKTLLSSTSAQTLRQTRQSP